MNKKWVVSTAFASFLAAVGISTTTSHVRASVSANDKDENDTDADQQDLENQGAVKDPTVASVMDAQGAPVTESVPSDESVSATSDDSTSDDKSTSASVQSSTEAPTDNETDTTTNSTDSSQTVNNALSASTQSSTADPASEQATQSAPVASSDSSESAATSSTSADSSSEDANGQTSTGTTVKTAPGFSKEVQAAISASPETNSQVLPTNDGTVLERSATSDGAVTQAATNSEQDEFLAMAAPMAEKAAGEYGLYTSVMLAQAILESGWGQSDLATEANNLFGIKGDYNGAYVSMPTSEWSADQGWYKIYANFRKYPSYYESFLDNADKLRNGISGSSTFYSGTWKENTTSYKDATAWLQGRYATAPNYASTLNNIIETYNLTQYDTDSETNPNLNDNNNSSGNNENTGSTTNPDTNVGGTQTALDDVAVVTNLDNAPIYTDAYINQPSARALGYGTAWKLASKVVDESGNVFYQVSTHEFVLATDVQLQSQGGTTTEPPVKIDDTVIVTGDSGAPVYSAANMNSATSKVLPYSSEWKTTTYVTDSDNNTFFLVGSNAYVLASDVVQKSKIGSNDEYLNDTTVDYPDILKVITAPSAKLYDTKHNLLSTSLTNGTDWRTDKKSTHADGTVWYRVSTDQWVSASDVQVLGSNYVKTVQGTVKINYIPGYGVNVYNSPAANNKFTGTRLADGTTWKVTSKQIVDGQTWYEVPAGWVNGKYCLFTPAN
ncbi:glycoside hydrolase family 73 protein [Companilactobacillus sp.]|jgi:flagellum-specific peptidoglycan hydrolase FlgJ|uniref:glycoside hydrolase family 73 protein n=1 Tax=Companilactobacillus sp. TaxID=2767905 RepID=UPI0025BA0183|nr:glycoside hydrolase family 73 protein [Companilactobacillus sp.]MCH4009937.1 glycoside hydrolase family 73 protein [Companilactobacillus sp.]MCH4052387.1 glycoside hydrolase family 73 protein [Companilactobacillus sp.]MCH4077879.1 glycoside hydrolase family 73 protein [Companilactobacillus sp.]MCH4126455.1 glycoside hydrolase family 73 protein [Companilactobacillus sp.]MCH4132041.1 glycoside hydrolase family 73 protein [Companilactobacillus sp.]